MVPYVTQNAFVRFTLDRSLAWTPHLRRHKRRLLNVGNLLLFIGDASIPIFISWILLHYSHFLCELFLRKLWNQKTSSALLSKQFAIAFFIREVSLELTVPSASECLCEGERGFSWRCPETEMPRMMYRLIYGFLERTPQDTRKVIISPTLESQFSLIQCKDTKTTQHRQLLLFCSLG